MGFFSRKPPMPASAAEALPGRPTPMPVPAAHAVSGRRLEPPFPTGTELALFGLGCFWGAERLFWTLPGVYSTSVGYAGGFTPNPSYEEVCSGRTGHAEVVRVVFAPASVLCQGTEEHNLDQAAQKGPDARRNAQDGAPGVAGSRRTGGTPQRASERSNAADGPFSAAYYAELLRIFWESHDPTQGMRQGNDVGSQYRSAIYCYGPAQAAAAQATRDAFQQALSRAGRGQITTEIREAPAFYYAEDYHQQYLAKNPGGYCGLAGTGVLCPTDAAAPGS